MRTDRERRVNIWRSWSRHRQRHTSRGSESASGKSNSSIKRSWGVIQHTNRHRGRGPKAPAHRRWPSGNPRLSAFCRSAPTVRFMAFAIFFTGDLLRECAFSSRTSAFDQVRRLVRLARLLAISHSCERHAAAATLSIAEPAWEEKTVEDFAKSERSRSR